MNPAPYTFILKPDIAINHIRVCGAKLYHIVGQLTTSAKKAHCHGVSSIFVLSLVVWQPGDNEVVERPVAERRVCVICRVPWSRLCRALLEPCECILRVRKTAAVCTYALTEWCSLPQKDRFVLYDLQKVFAVDALASSHPLSRRENEVNEPAEISEMFNTISYNKVGSHDIRWDTSPSTNQKKTS